MKKKYRKNVGMVIFNSLGEVLVGERLNFPGSWQFPQGGIDEGEDPETAAKRELFEETGIENGVIIYELGYWITYDFPEEIRNSGRFKGYFGQKQKWFLIFWDNPSSLCILDKHEQEFGVVKFIPLNSCLETIVKFKLSVYETLVKEFSPIISNYIKQLKKV